MNNFNPFDIDNEVRIARELTDLKGFFCDEQGEWYLDRRKSIVAMADEGLSPRTADLNLIGPAIIPVPKYLVIELELGADETNI